MQIIFFLYALFTVGVIILAAFLSYPEGTDTIKWGTFATLAGVGLTATSSICAAAISTMTALSQSRAMLELEAVKIQLDNLNKASNDIGLAAIRYYYTISKLEIGKIDKTKMNTAEEKMIDSAYYTIAELES